MAETGRNRSHIERTLDIIGSSPDVYAGVEKIKLDQYLLYEVVVVGIIETVITTALAVSVAETVSETESITALNLTGIFQLARVRNIVVLTEDKVVRLKSPQLCSHDQEFPPGSRALQENQGCTHILH